MGVNCRICVVRPQSNASHNRGSLRVQTSPLSLSYPEFSFSFIASVLVSSLLLSSDLVYSRFCSLPSYLWVTIA